jgi:hypothetical protein
MVWAYCKVCTYNFHDLVLNLPETLHDVPLPFHRRALTHCFRFMSGKRRGLKGRGLVREKRNVCCCKNAHLACFRHTYFEF